MFSTNMLAIFILLPIPLFMAPQTPIEKSPSFDAVTTNKGQAFREEQRKTFQLLRLLKSQSFSGATTSSSGQTEKELQHKISPRSRFHEEKSQQTKQEQHEQQELQMKQEKQEQYEQQELQRQILLQLQMIQFQQMKQDRRTHELEQYQLQSKHKYGMLMGRVLKFHAIVLRPLIEKCQHILETNHDNNEKEKDFCRKYNELNFAITQLNINYKAQLFSGQTEDTEGGMKACLKSISEEVLKQTNDLLDLLKGEIGEDTSEKIIAELQQERAKLEKGALEKGANTDWANTIKQHTSKIFVEAQTPAATNFKIVYDNQLSMRTFSKKFGPEMEAVLSLDQFMINLQTHTDNNYKYFELDKIVPKWPLGEVFML